MFRSDVVAALLMFCSAHRLPANQFSQGKQLWSKPVFCSVNHPPLLILLSNGWWLKLTLETPRLSFIHQTSRTSDIYANHPKM